MRTLAQLGFDGLAALQWAVAGSDRYSSLEQAVASLAVFVSPETVSQTSGNIFQMVRGSPRRNFDNRDRPTVMLDDNEGPQLVLKAAGGPTVTGRHLNLNHLYGARRVEFFTNFRTICVTPAFLTKVTDSDSRILALLKRRAFRLYDFAPEGEPLADSYDELDWAPPLSPIANFEAVLSDRLRHTTCSAAKSVRQFGWCFNDFAGDPWG